MKRLFYNLLMFAIALTAVASCGNQAEVLKSISTNNAYTSGDYDWYVKITDDDSYVTAIASDCDTLFYAATTVTLELTEKVKLPENMTAEFKGISLYMYGVDKIDIMKPNEEGYEQIKKFLNGGAGKEVELTFISPTKLSMSAIKQEIESVDNFSIRGVSFTVDGNIRKKRLFECLFDGADVNSVITELEASADEAKKALNEYLDTESDSDYAQLEQLYDEVTVTIKKLEASIDEDDLTRSQQNRLYDAYDIVEEVYDEL